LQSQSGCQVEIIPVKRSDGCVDLNALSASLDKDSSASIPTLIALMWCNNEIPARNPIEEIATLCAKHKAFFHCDAVQGIVRENINTGQLSALGLSSMVFAPHKIYGPKGIGVLVIPERSPMLRLDAPLQGGEQEKGLRPGTLNTLAIIGAGVAVSVHENRRPELLTHLQSCDDTFIDAMTANTPGFSLTIPRAKSCPGIVNFHVDRVDAQSLIHEISEVVCANRGASCSGAGGEKIRHVPTALGLPVEIAANVIRVSFGFGNSLEDARRAADFFIQAIKKMRK
jgi:cysteine desulfurase